MLNLSKPLTVLALLLAVSDRGQAQNRCRAAGWESAQFKGSLTRMMDSDQADVRAHFALPLVTPAQITLVSDSTVCARAGQAMDAYSRTVDPTPRGPSTIQLYVFQVGSSFAVVDTLTPNDADADFIYFFDASWNFTGFAFVQ
jgi:hypothetical protein